MKRKWLLSIGVFITLLILLVVLLMVISIPPNPTQSQLKVKNGVVNKITFDERTKDVNIYFDDNVIYYINRGLEQGIYKDSFENAILGKVVDVTYYEPKYDIMALINKFKGRTIFKLQSSGKVYFDKLHNSY